jgi:hypothetical protein
MAKESNTPKAINIVRPGHSITTAPKFQVFSPLRNNAKPPSDIHKPKVMTTAQISLNDRPGLALFAPQSQKHVLDTNSNSNHRQLSTPSNRVPAVIISASSLNTTAVPTQNRPYTSRTSSTSKSQISVHSSAPRPSSVISIRSDISLGLASVHSDKSRSSSSSQPYATERNTIRWPPGIVKSNDITFKDPPRRTVNVPISENNLDEDQPRYYDLTTNGEDDTNSDRETEPNNDTSDWNSSIESAGEEEVNLDDQKVEDDEDEDAESPINEARINRKVGYSFILCWPLLPHLP